MADLENQYNIYADIAQGSYKGRDDNFPYEELSPSKRNRLDKGESVKFNFPHAKDAYGNDASTIYLQPDPIVKTIKGKNFLGREKEYQKGLLTDEKAGYNSYFVTDTPTLNEKTKHTYFATRGSDAISLHTLNDWVENNGSFTLFNSYIPQAKLATKAMHQKITEMTTKAPNATGAVSGLSLGTMVSIQAVANLPEKDIAKIDKVVLFQGPDARKSVNRMSEQAQKNIQQLEEQGKIDYYVNAFDIVSVLNRNKKGVDEIGNVHYLLPKSFTTIFDTEDKNGSSHDFGQYQLNPDGVPKEANVNEHAYIFAAGIKVSKLIDKYLVLIVRNTKVNITSGNLLATLMGGGVLYLKFQKEYEAIISEAKIASQWQERVTSIQKSLSTASGNKKIELRADLARAVAQKAKNIGEEYENLTKNVLQETEEEIDALAREIKESAMSIRQYLSYAEVQEMIAPYEKSRLWDNGQVASDHNQVKKYKEKMIDFSEKLITVAKNIQDYDGQAGNVSFKK